jgi:hypothetical protein
MDEQVIVCVYVHDVSRFHLNKQEAFLLINYLFIWNEMRKRTIFF